MAFSRALALAGGIVLPILETARRWEQLADPRMFLAWFDDYLIAAFLIYGWWRTTNRDAGRPVLAGAWGFACGMAYMSLTGTLMELSQPDPSGLASQTVAAIKAVMLAAAVAALIATLRSRIRP